jgi:drug/metabolite transporter (DMT)-like permease
LAIFDLFASSFLFWAFMAKDAPQHGMRRLWIYVVLNLCVGLITAMGLYFYSRERAATRE